ncbi:unnamed protein product [Closterium sp. Naga37s-1]|nr:unnamed protein product [Closterium sp. Naga37s-1]
MPHLPESQHPAYPFSSSSGFAGSFSCLPWPPGAPWTRTPSPLLLISLSLPACFPPMPFPLLRRIFLESPFLLPPFPLLPVLSLMKLSPFFLPAPQPFSPSRDIFFPTFLLLSRSMACPPVALLLFPALCFILVHPLPSHVLLVTSLPLSAQVLLLPHPRSTFPSPFSPSPAPLSFFRARILLPPIRLPTSAPFQIIPIVLFFTILMFLLFTQLLITPSRLLPPFLPLKGLSFTVSPSSACSSAPMIISSSSFVTSRVLPWGHLWLAALFLTPSPVYLSLLPPPCLSDRFLHQTCSCTWILFYFFTARSRIRTSGVLRQTLTALNTRFPLLRPLPCRRALSQ